MIQFNIQFNIWFQIFIQFNYSFNALLQLFIQSNYSIQYSFWNIQFKILFKTLEKHYSKFYPDLRIGKNANNPFNRPWICGFSEVKCVENMKLGEIVPQKWRFNKETVVSMFTLEDFTRATDIAGHFFNFFINSILYCEIFIQNVIHSSIMKFHSFLGNIHFVIFVFHSIQKNIHVLTRAFIQFKISFNSKKILIIHSRKLFILLKNQLSNTLTHTFETVYNPSRIWILMVNEY